MKTHLTITGLACGLFLLSACTGDHQAHSGKDTVINTYKAAKDTSKMDTSKVKSSDNSATGGIENKKDTVRSAKPDK